MTYVWADHTCYISNIRPSQTKGSDRPWPKTMNQVNLEMNNQRSRRHRVQLALVSSFIFSRKLGIDSFFSSLLSFLPLRYESFTLILYKKLSILIFQSLPPHSVLYWPSTQLHLLVTHSWANWIQHMVVNSCIEIINYHFHCHDPLSYCQHMVVHSSVKTINYYYSYHYHCHDHLSYRQHMIANSCVEMHGKSGVRWDKQRANTQDLEISLDWV